MFAEDLAPGRCRWHEEKTTPDRSDVFLKDFTIEAMLCDDETVLEAALLAQEQHALVELVILVESVVVVEPSVK